MFDDIIWDGVAAAGAKVAIMYSNSADTWGSPVTTSQGAAKRTLYVMLRHLGLATDVVTEEDAVAGHLNHYGALFVVDAQISEAAVAGIGAWAKAGGQAFVTSGGGLLNEFNHSNSAMAALIPVTQSGVWTGSKHSRFNATIFYAKQDLAFVEKLDEVTIADDGRHLGVYGEKSVFKFSPRPTDDAHVLGTFGDGSPAVVNISVGSHGGGVTYAGFHLGLSYFRPSLPLRPVDRSPSMKSLTNLVPTDFDVGARRLAEVALRTPATRDARTVLVDNPLVEVGLVTRHSNGVWNGTAMPMVDWSATEGNGSGTGYTRVVVTLPNSSAVPFTTATLASCGKGKACRGFIQGNTTRPGYLRLNRTNATFSVDLDIADAIILRTDDAHATVQTGKTMAAFPLAGVQCLNGQAPVVWVNASAQVKDWVVQIGSQSITTSFCISEKTCALFATPPTGPPPPPPGPMAVSNAGPQSSDCTINPTFCKFNQAQISDCTMDLLLGDNDETMAAETNGSVTAHFQGQKLLKASLAKLAELGLSAAERVLLNGVGWGGTSVILNADSVGAQLKTLAPGLKDYRAVAADAIHPKRFHLLWSDHDGPGGNIGGQPYDALTGWLEAHTKLSKPDAALEPGCKARNPQAPWLCLYVNETLPFVTTPIYLVNQMASIWDTFCNIDGVETDDALQISCTPHGDFAIMEWHYCFQYVNHGRPRTCTAPQIMYVVRPFQEQYINETKAAGLMNRSGNGAFMHSCHSGGYWVSADGPKGEWNMISVGNVTMQQAVSAWWDKPTSAPSTFIADCFWTDNAPFICNPVCSTLPGPY